jgi:hypothetical protein
MSCCVRSRIEGARGDGMIEMRRAQLSFGDGSAHSITSSAREQREREGEAERLSGTSAGKQLDTGRRLRPAGRP